MLVVADHRAERSGHAMTRGTQYVICDNNGNPGHRRACQADHRGQVDRA